MGEDNQNDESQRRKYLFAILGLILLFGGIALVPVGLILGDSDSLLPLILLIFAFSFFIAGAMILDSISKGKKRDIMELLWVVCGAVVIVIGLWLYPDNIGGILLWGIAMILTGVILYCISNKDEK